MKPNNEQASGLVVGRSNRFGIVRNHKVLVWTVIVVVLILAGASAYLVFFHHKGEDTGGRKVYKVRQLSAADEHVVNSVVRADGVIQSVAADSVTFMPTGQSKPLVLKTNSATAYSHGNIGLPGKRDDLQAGHKAVFTYDKSNNIASAVWVDYDKQ